MFLIKQRNIYIILTRTTTVVSRLISHLTGDIYTHASIARTKDLSAMYSFGRKQRYNPFMGGFCRENPNEGIFAGCKVLPYAMIRVKVTQEQYDKVSLLIQEYIRNAEQYRYNYTGLLFAGLGKAHKCSRRFYCSEFVYDLLRQCEIICEEPLAVIRPQDLIRYGTVIEEGDWNLNKKGPKMRKPLRSYFALYLRRNMI